MEISMQSNDTGKSNEKKNTRKGPDRQREGKYVRNMENGVYSIRTTHNCTSMLLRNV